MTQKKDNFIMLPKVDICFKGLMNNPKVRKGFIAALLQKAPETIRETELLPTVLRQDYPDEKLGILDVRVKMEDGKRVYGSVGDTGPGAVQDPERTGERNRYHPVDAVPEREEQEGVRGYG